jgi:integrase
LSRPAGAPRPRPDWDLALDRLEGAYAENTLTGWRDGFRHFERWCEGRGVVALPADPETVAGFVEALFASYRLNTVLNRLYAVRMVSRTLGHVDPTATESVRLAVRRGKRVYGVRSRQAPGLAGEVLQRMLQACPDDLRGLRDRALLRVGHDSLCRGGQLLALCVEDIRLLPDGTARAAVRLDKQDYAGDGLAYLSADAVRALEAWLKASGVASGPVFRGINGRFVLEGRLTRSALNKRLKEIGRVAGLDEALAARMCAHSLRVGAVQDLTLAGASVLQIMRAGRWRHVGQVAYYARNAPVNLWGQTEGDGYPLAAKVQRWRRVRRAAPLAKRVRLATSR